MRHVSALMKTQEVMEDRAPDETAPVPATATPEQNTNALPVSLTLIAGEGSSAEREGLDAFQECYHLLLSSMLTIVSISPIGT